MIKLTVSANKQQRTANNGATCGFADIEIDPSLLKDPNALAAQIRLWYELAQVAVEEELNRLNRQAVTKPAQTPAPARGTPNPANASTNGNGHHVTPPQPHAEANGQADEDDDAPRNGSQLLGWARKQEEDAKGWIISYGQRRKFEGRVIDWTEHQVNQAYAACRRAIEA